MVSRKKERRRPSADAETAYEQRTRYTITPEDFAMTWNSSSSAEEVAEKLGMPKPIVLARVSNYRKRGVRLKKMKRKNARRLDVESLNRLITETAAKEKGSSNVNEQMVAIPESLRPMVETIAKQAAQQGAKEVLRLLQKQGKLS